MGHFFDNIFRELIWLVGYRICSKNIWSNSRTRFGISFISNTVDGAHVINNGW